MVSDDPFRAAPPRRARRRVVAVAIVVAFLAGLVVAGAAIHYYGTAMPWAAPSGKARPAPKVTASAAAPQPAGTRPEPGAADYDALAAREAALAARLSDLEARAATIDMQASAASGNATRAEGLLVAFAARRALDRGLGLGYVEGQLRARFGATQPRAVATVIDASRAPVTLEDLRLGLASIGPDLVHAGDQGWLPSIRGTLSTLIIVHKAGVPSPRPTDRLDRARHLLEGGQVEAALAEVSRLPGASKAQRWIDAARRYVDARHALDVLETAAIIGQAKQPASAPPPPPAAAPALDSSGAAGAKANPSPPPAAAGTATSG